MNLNVRRPAWPLVALAMILGSCVVWLRTIWRRKHGLKLMSRGRESLSERYVREGIMERRDAA